MGIQIIPAANRYSPKSSVNSEPFHKAITNIKAARKRSALRFDWRGTNNIAPKDKAIIKEMLISRLMMLNVRSITRQESYLVYVLTTQ